MVRARDVNSAHVVPSPLMEGGVMEEVVHPLHAADVLDEMESRIIRLDDLAKEPNPREERAASSWPERGAPSEVPD
jgi:hypothetical protein